MTGKTLWRLKRIDDEDIEITRWDDGSFSVEGIDGMDSAHIPRKTAAKLGAALARLAGK